MHQDVSRLVGLDGFEVRAVTEQGDQLDLGVELVARAGAGPHCGRTSLDIQGPPAGADA